MEMDEVFLTLLTPEGEFLRARKQDGQYQLGEEIHFFPIESNLIVKNNPLKKLIKIKPVWTVGMLAVILFLVGSFIPMYQNNKAYAYMSIDASPSIELGLNKKMQVVELIAFNKEGKKVISALNDWKKKDVCQLTENIITIMKKEGFTAENKAVTISTVRVKDTEEKVEAMLKEDLQEIKNTVTNHELEVSVYKGTETELKKAHEQGITTGKYYENKEKSSGNKSPAHKKIDNKEKTIPVQPQPTDSAQPQGQIEKQTENSQTQKNEVKKTEDSLPPGQLKKMEEKNVEGQSKNYGQWKKQQNQFQANLDKNNHSNSNDSHDWKKNQNNWNQNQNSKSKQEHEKEINNNKDR